MPVWEYKIHFEVISETIQTKLISAAPRPFREEVWISTVFFNCLKFLKLGKRFPLWNESYILQQAIAQKYCENQ